MEFLISIAPAIGTILFFSIFCYIVFSVFKKGAKKKLDKFSQIPFKEKD